MEADKKDVCRYAYNIGNLQNNGQLKKTRHNKDNHLYGTKECGSKTACNKTTLVIHPQDKTTTFLKRIYEEIPNKTVITGGINETELLKLIERHDRIMMMGHGSPYGLYRTPSFREIPTTYVIHKKHVELLSKKKDSVFIWCNADMFVGYYDLKGFYTGMFISEVGEAFYCGLPNVSQKIVTESNNFFAEILKKYILENKNAIHENVKKEYSVLSQNNPIVFYNNLRLYKN